MKISALFFTLACVVHAQQLASISANNILMPVIHDRLGIKLKLTAYHDCYLWSSSQPAALSVNSAPNSACDQQDAYVSVLTRIQVEQLIWITAVPQDTSKKELRVEATIREIYKIEILTKQRTIDLETQEELHVRGFDKDGNTFSTLEGVRFLWKCEGVELQLVNLSNSTLEVSDTRLAVEREGFMSDIMLVEGLKIGKGTVTVVLREEGYREPIVAKVQLTVIERFTLFPNLPVFYLPHNSKVLFGLMLVKGNKLRAIQLPSSSHTWSVDSKLSSIEQNGVLTTTSVEVDKTLRVSYSPENYVSAVYHVVQVGGLGLDVIDTEFQMSHEEQYFQSVYNVEIRALLVDRQYLLRGFLMDKSGNRIFSQEKVTLSHQYITIEKGSYFIKHSRIEKIKVHLEYKSLQQDAEIRFVYPIKVHTPYSYIHLPLQEVYQLHLTEGSGEYLSHVQHFSVAEVSQDHQLRTKMLGSTNLTLSDKWNKYNRIEINLFVTEVADFMPLELKKELLIHNLGYAYFIAQGLIKNRLQNYTQCFSAKFETDKIPTPQNNQTLSLMIEQLKSLISNSVYKFSVLLPSRIQNYPDTFGVCSSIALLPDVLQELEIKIFYRKIVKVMDVRVYEPLQISEGALLLSPFSEYEFHVVGGNRLWETQLIERNHNAISHTYQNRYLINCPEAGHENFYIERYNEASLSLPGPLILKIDLPIVCELPSYFRLINSKTNQEIKWVYANEAIKVGASAYNSKDRKFNRFTSLNLNWHSEIPLNYLEGHLNAVSGYGGVGKLTLASKNYIEPNSRVYFTEIKSQFTIKVYQPIKVRPEKATILIGQSKEFQVLDGSGQYECRYQNEIVDCKNSTILLSNLKAGEGKLEVTDKDLGSQAYALIEVVEPDSIKLIFDTSYVIVNKEIDGRVEISYKGQKINEVNWKDVTIYEEKKQISTASKNDIHTFAWSSVGQHNLVARFNNRQSMEVTVFVIQSIQAFPQTLYLPPNCQGYVELTQYSFAHLQYVAEPSANLNLHAVQNYVFVNSTSSVGTFSVTVQLKDTHVIGVATFKVVVGPVSKVNVKYAGRAIDLHSTVRLVGEVFVEKNPISLCLCPFLFKWSIPGLLEQAGQDLYAIKLKATKEGKFDVQLTVEGQTNYQQTITVVAPNRLGRQLYIGQEDDWKGPLLIPYNSTYRFSSSIEKVQECGQFSAVERVSEYEIRAREISRCPVFIEYNQQMVAFEVQRVYQLFPLMEAELVNIRDTAQVAISLLNQNGRVFEKAKENLIKVQAITPLFVTFKEENNVLTLTNNNFNFGGRALIKISYQDSLEIVDYIQVRIGAFIEPANIQVYVGSQINFSIPNIQSDAWRAECGTFNKNVLTVTQLGSCEVQLLEAGYTHKAKITVVKPLAVEIYPRGEQGETRDTVNLDIRLLPEIQAHPRVGFRPSVGCAIASSTWFTAVADPNHMQCVVKAVHAKSTQPMTKDFQVEVEVKNAYFELTSQRRFPLQRELVLEERVVTLGRGEQQKQVRVPFYQSVEVQMDSALHAIVSTRYDDKASEMVIEIDVQRQTSDAIEGRLYFLTSGIKQESKSIFIRYDPNAQTFNSQDIMLIVCAAVLLIVIVYNYLSQ